MKILVYRIGSLGDTLVLIPSIWALKDRLLTGLCHSFAPSTDHGNRLIDPDICPERSDNRFGTSKEIHD